MCVSDSCSSLALRTEGEGKGKEETRVSFHACLTTNARAVEGDEHDPRTTLSLAPCPCPQLPARSAHLFENGPGDLRSPAAGIESLSPGCEEVDVEENTVGR